LQFILLIEDFIEVMESTFFSDPGEIGFSLDNFHCIALYYLHLAVIRLLLAVFACPQMMQQQRRERALLSLGKGDSKTFKLVGNTCS